MNRILSILIRSRKIRTFPSNTYNFNRFYGSIYEPEYLKLLEPEYPSYPTLNVELKGYDFTILEHYAKYVAQTANHLGINVVESYPIPGKKLLIQCYLPGTTTQAEAFNLTLYERNVKITELTSIMAPIFIEVIKDSLPAGIQININEVTDEMDNYRYIPDLELLELKQQLEDSGEKPKKK